MQTARLSARFGFHRNRGADGVAIAVSATETKSDRRRKVLHHILQEAQLRTIAIFQENFQPAIMIEIGEGEGPAILEEVQTHGARNVRKRAIAVVCVEDIALEPAPGAVRADEFVERVPSLFVIVGRLGLHGRIGNHLSPEETVQVFARLAGHHPVGDVKIGKAVVVKIPRVARPRPPAHLNSGGCTSILKNAVAGIAKQRIAHRVFTVEGAGRFGRILVEDWLS